MSAFQNVIDLRFAVADHVGNRSISDVFPRLISLAEGDLNSRLRTRHQIRSYTLTLDEGEAPLPPDFLEIIRVNGRCDDYSVDGFSISLPGRSGDVDIAYYASLPTLSCSPVASNWLLSKYPSVYLYGVSLQAAKFLKDVEVAVATSSLYAEALQLLKVDDERARYATTPIRVRGATP